MPLEGVACGTAVVCVARRTNDVTILRRGRMAAALVFSLSRWAIRSDEGSVLSSGTWSQLLK